MVEQLSSGDSVRGFEWRWKWVEAGGSGWEWVSGSGGGKEVDGNEELRKGGIREESYGEGAVKREYASRRESVSVQSPTSPPSVRSPAARLCACPCL